MAEVARNPDVDLDSLKMIADIASQPPRIELSSQLPNHLQDHNIAALHREYASQKLHRKRSNGQEKTAYREKQDSETCEKSTLTSSADGAAVMERTKDTGVEIGVAVKTTNLIDNNANISTPIECTSPLVSFGIHLFTRIRAVSNKICATFVEALSIDDSYSSG